MMTRRFVFVVLIGTWVAASACTRNPEKLKLRYMANGDRYAAANNHLEAIIEYRNAVNQVPDFGEARYKLALEYEATGDLKNALNEYVRAADLMPDHVAAQLHAGRLLLSAQQFPEAKARAAAALQKEPKN